MQLLAQVGYFQNAMKGEISISDVIISQVENHQEVQVLSVPIMNQGKVRGVVFGIVNVGTMDRLMENEIGSDIYTKIVDSKGNYITRIQTKDSLIKSNNVWTDFEGIISFLPSIMSIWSNGRTALIDKFFIWFFKWGLHLPFY